MKVPTYIKQQAKAIEKKYGCQVDLSGYSSDVNDANFKAKFPNGYICSQSSLHTLDFCVGLAKVTGLTK